ncbi:uncharacterized protein LOC142698051 [Rhinoderma darwinii]|uniref:uncharacterized protein LOC142698051 n=1 Tax=Rhinoderma darwinii TaxID=43563 RepID=UPI003F674B38
MLLRLFLIVTVLLASVEGAPIGIRGYESVAENRINTNIRGDLLYGPCSTTCGIGSRVIYVTKGCPDGKDICFFRMEQCRGPEDCGVPPPPPTTEAPKYFWNKIIVIAASIANIFLLGTFYGVVCYVRYKRKSKSKSTRDVETQCSMDEITESNDKKNGNLIDCICFTKQEDKEHRHLSGGDEHLELNKEEVGINSCKDCTPTETASYISPMQQIHQQILAYHQNQDKKHVSSCDSAELQR